MRYKGTKKPRRLKKAAGVLLTISLLAAFMAIPMAVYCQQWERLPWIMGLAAMDTAGILFILEDGKNE